VSAVAADEAAFPPTDPRSELDPHDAFWAADDEDRIGEQWFASGREQLHTGYPSARPAASRVAKVELPRFRQVCRLVGMVGRPHPNHLTIWQEPSSAVNTMRPGLNQSVALSGITEFRVIVDFTPGAPPSGHTFPFLIGANPARSALRLCRPARAVQGQQRPERRSCRLVLPGEKGAPVYCAHRAGEQPSLKRSNFFGFVW